MHLVVLTVDGEGARGRAGEVGHVGVGGSTGDRLAVVVHGGKETPAPHRGVAVQRRLKHTRQVQR